MAVASIGHLIALKALAGRRPGSKRGSGGFAWFTRLYDYIPNLLA
jgi:hypothetical protein